MKCRKCKRIMERLELEFDTYNGLNIKLLYLCEYCNEFEAHKFTRRDKE